MYEVGDAVGRFVVRRVLGEGATSVVCEVEDAGERRALKVLGLRSSELRRRMAQEGALVQRLEHPNIVRLYEVLEVDDRPALLLELVDGRPLDRWLAERERVDPAEAERLALALLDAVGHAHAHGIIHRDLKPGNVLVTAEGVPKVVDFGLAKALASDVALTRPGVLLGTAAYAAPEQMKDARLADARSDVFSLGCLLYELFCGARAFPGRRAAEVMGAAARGDYVPPEQVAPELPERVVRAIRGALAPEPADRIPDVATLRATLTGALAAPAPAPAPAGGSPWRRLAPVLAVGGVAAAAIAAAAALVVVAAVVVAAVAWRAAPAAPPPAPVIDAHCLGGPAGQVIGWAWAGSAAPRAPVWTVRADTNVRADRPRAENGFDKEAPIVCVLPKGARVRLDEEPVRVPGAVWVPILGDAVEVP